MSRPRTRPALATYAPLRTVILAVDTAATSGTAVRVLGRLIVSGEVNTLDAPDVLATVRRAQHEATKHNLPLSVVLESPYGGPAYIVAALGAARERWRVALDTCRVSQRHVMRVQPNTWRSGLWGPKWARAPRDEIRAHELATARAETGIEDIGPDEAAAIGISRWAARAYVVADHMGIPR